MGEAIISRAGGGSGGSKEDIPSDISIMLVTLMDSNGNPVDGIPIQCNDAGIYYNYATNSNGQVLFHSLKSGWANLNISNIYENGVIILDQKSNGWYNIEAPFGKNTKTNLSLNFINGIKSIANGNYRFLVTNIANLNMAGGRGGDGADINTYWVTAKGGYSTTWTYGGKGGNAKQIIQNNIAIDKNKIYEAHVGVLGSSATDGKYNASGGLWSRQPGDVTSGGTSSFLGYSATGGGAGSSAIHANSSYSGANGSNGTSYGNWTGAGYIQIQY
nr:MAG TPA: hypothetical protein [Caudoviricetes sp.]